MPLPTAIPMDPPMNEKSNTAITVLRPPTSPWATMIASVRPVDERESFNRSEYRFRSRNLRGSTTFPGSSIS
jgi:hypothetical protein